MHRGEFCFATEGNVVNPRIGSDLQYGRGVEEEKTAEVVENHGGGTRMGIGIPSRRLAGRGRDTVTPQGGAVRRRRRSPRSQGADPARIEARCRGAEQSEVTSKGGIDGAELRSNGSAVATGERAGATARWSTGEEQLRIDVRRQ